VKNALVYPSILAIILLAIVVLSTTGCSAEQVTKLQQEIGVLHDQLEGPGTALLALVTPEVQMVLIGIGTVMGVFAGRKPLKRGAVKVTNKLNQMIEKL